MLIRHPAATDSASGRIFLSQGSVRAEVLCRREDGARVLLYDARVDDA